MIELEHLHDKLHALPDSLFPLNNPLLIQSHFELNKYSKLASIIRLKSAGLPTLPGFVVENLTSDILEYLNRWNINLNAKRLSLRFDSPNPEDHKKLQGSNPTLEDLSQMIHFFKPPIIGIVMAENDRFNQDHSVLTRFSEEYILCEIVGPGFDAADLTRGNISPHESFEIERKGPEIYDSELCMADIVKHDLTEPEYYQLSRGIRYGVIFSIIEKGLGKAVTSKDLSSSQTSQVDKFLTSRGASISKSYTPLGYERLRQIYRYLGQLASFSKYYKESFQLDIEDRVLSASFLKKYCLVFWDLYGADKYTKR